FPFGKFTRFVLMKYLPEPRNVHNNDDFTNAGVISNRSERPKAPDYRIGFLSKRQCTPNGDWNVEYPPIRH
ncbi:hypothetical protein OFM15_30775, partial [Escherichia coli]|nr:hypothetical protein [Escherichia coli]